TTQRIGKQAMTHSAAPDWEELPAGASETILADFLDAALDRIAGGETVSARGLLERTPELIGPGERLLEKATNLVDAAGVLRTQDAELQSDLVSLFAGEGGGATDDAATRDYGPLPEPFPGEFRLVRRLGSGSFGTVWLAEDLHLGRFVALKTVR